MPPAIRPSAVLDVRLLMWAWTYSGVLINMDLSLVVLLYELNESTGPCGVIGSATEL